MMTRLRPILLQVGVGLGILILACISIAIFPLSEQFAASNPQVAYMRGPVLALVIPCLICAWGVLILGFVLLERIRRNQVFVPQTVADLRRIGWLCFAAILPLTCLAIHTEKNVASSITNLYVYGLIAICFMLGNLFMLLGALFASAVSYKAEMDLTV
jgi:hypothetical protein